MKAETISGYYAADHDRLDELFARYRSLKANEPMAARATFDEFRSGLQRHIAWEEDILFPVFESYTGMRHSGPTAVMRAEHRQIEHCLDVIGKGLHEGDGATDDDDARLLSILESHNFKEEQVLYPAIDHQVTTGERDEVFDRMARVPGPKD